MTRDSGGLGARLKLSVRPLIALVALLTLPALAACTTAEGTNALVSPSTFEHEVMDPTLQGLDIIPPDAAKPDPRPRGPLVLPKSTAQLPTPTVAAPLSLPADSASPQMSTAGLSQADINNLKNAKVIDLQSANGRPLTDAERKQLAARLAAANVKVAAVNGNRPLTLPPVSYFTQFHGTTAVCKAQDGSLVSLTDSRCPQKIRDALKPQSDAGGSVSNGMDSAMYNMRNGIQSDPVK
jgi:hypothetical protein